MGIPEFLVIAWYLFGVGFVASRHGKPREIAYNGWATATVTAIMLGLLWWGGFFI